jgi:hypothetical protein
VGAEARVLEEPGAGKLHAGICAGGAPASLPRLYVEGLQMDMTNRRQESSNLDASPSEDSKTAILAQFHAAEYAAFMGRVSSWESLQYGAWPILIAAVSFLFQIDPWPWNFRWWAALISFLFVYVAYQGTMVNMLYSVLVIERDLRPRASKLVGNENFWIYERIRERTFPSNPAWSMLWPPIISSSVTVSIAGGLAYKYGLYWQDIACLVLAVVLGIFITILTRNAIRVKKEIIKACIPEVEPVMRTVVE